MNIQTLKSELQGTLHGTTLNQITGLDGVINRAARQLLLDVDPMETRRIVPMTTPVYVDVYSYGCPTDLKGNKVIDIRPQVNRTLRDQFTQEYNEDFDVYKRYALTPSFTINTNTGIKTLRINNPILIPGIVINTCDSITSNGTWAVSPLASNLTEDNVNFVNNSSSLKFNLDAGAPGSTGYIQNSTMTAVDLTDHLNQSSLFFYVYLPTGSDFTSVELRWGSSPTDYWTKTVTIAQDGTAFQNGWNLLRADWATATTVGAPVVTAVDTIRVTFTYNGTLQTAVRLDGVVSSLGTIMEIEYYSKYLFRDAITGAFQETVTDDSNIINLDTESYNLLFDLTVLYCVQQALGSTSTYDTQFFTDKYNQDLRRYMALYKSEFIKPKTTYYWLPNPSPGQYWGNSSTHY